MADSSPPWLPTVYTPPLSEEFETDGDYLLEVAGHMWTTPLGEPMQLDEWQRWLIRHMLERYPADHPKYAGQLRYKQIVVSLGRQNGKTEIGGLLATDALLKVGSQVVSVASTVDQANLLYKRVRRAFDTNKTLSRRYKTTGTRGITSKVSTNPAEYVVKAGRADGLQGIPISRALFDEIHICPSDSWEAVRFGTSAQRDGQVIGITTAGDENSELLKRLYTIGRQAAAQEGDYDERFGFFLWEAPDHLGPEDPEALIAANPAIACGRLDLETELRALKHVPETQARRYRLNQFVASESAWLPMSMWKSVSRGPIPEGSPIFFSVERTLKWDHASIVASKKIGNTVYSELVASVVSPDIDLLEDMMVELWNRHNPSKIFMQQVTLRDLAMRLRERGLPVEYLTQSQMTNVCATAYSLISERRVQVGKDPLVDAQIPKGVAKTSNDGWRISARDSIGDVDALQATLIGIYGAEVTKPAPELKFTVI